MYAIYMLQILIFTFLIPIVYISYRYVRHRYEFDKYRDFLTKEKMLKIIIFKDLHKYFQNIGVGDPAGFASGVLMIFTNQNLSDLRSNIDNNLLKIEAEKILDNDKSLQNMVLIYLRTKSLFEAMYNNNMHFMPIKGLASHMIIKYGVDTTKVNDYKIFFYEFLKFSKNRI